MHNPVVILSGWPNTKQPRRMDSYYGFSFAARILIAWSLCITVIP